MLKSLKKIIIEFIDRLILPSVESHQKKYEKNKKSIQKSMIKNLTLKVDTLKDIILDSYEDKGSVYIYFKDYKNLIKDLKNREYISPKYQEDVIRKDIMLNLYKVRDKKNLVWFLIIDITNSPNISLRDYWVV